MNTYSTEHDDALEARTRRIDLAHQPDFDLGSVTVRPSLRTISGPGGETMLEPKVMQVLVALADPIGAILSRDDLIERCWEGRIVGDTSINRVISLLRSGLKEVAGGDASVENVPKVGYRLLVADAPNAPEGSTTAAPEPATTAAAPETAARSRKFVFAGAGVFALLAALAAIFMLQPGNSAALPPVKVAMLPISVSDGVDPLYAKGLESELRSQLARVGQMEVTSSDTARQLFEEGLSVDEICRRLGVDYAWAGALTVEAERVSLKSRLIEANSKQDAYREELTSAPDAAQYLPLRNARAISEALGRSVSGRLPQSSVSAGDYSLYVTALGLIKGRGEEQRVAALEIMEQVTQRNPGFADGWAGLAKARFLSPVPDDSFEGGNWGEAERLAEYALTLDPDSVDALKVAGQLVKDRERGLAMLKRATELDPGDSEAWFWLGIHERKSILLPAANGGPLESAKRMLAIDPLWPATWRAADTAAEFGQVDLARKMERDIIAAAITPAQRYLAEARLARYEGDLSGFFTLSARAAPTQTSAERRYGVASQVNIARVLLGMPAQSLRVLPSDPVYPLLVAIGGGELPPLSEFEAAGFGGANFWNSDDLAVEAMPLFLRDGREAELVALFDARFPTHKDYLAFADKTGMPEYLIPEASAYMVVAMRRLGRDKDAAAHIASADKQIARWKATDLGWVVPLLMELNVAAAKGDTERAIEIVRMLPDFGWPYSMSHMTPQVVGLLTGNPLHDDIRDLPEVRAVLDPIRANLAKERAEALAAGV